MYINENGVDRVIRTIAGIAILALVFVGPKTLWGLFGLVPLITGIVGFCPIYRLFGISTKKLSPPAGGVKPLGA